jgi:hypothetical protein
MNSHNEIWIECNIIEFELNPKFKIEINWIEHSSFLFWI